MNSAITFSVKGIVNKIYSVEVCFDVSIKFEKDKICIGIEDAIINSGEFDSYLDVIVFFSIKGEIPTKFRIKMLVLSPKTTVRSNYLKILRKTIKEAIHGANLNINIDNTTGWKYFYTSFDSFKRIAILKNKLKLIDLDLFEMISREKTAVSHGIILMEGEYINRITNEKYKFLVEFIVKSKSKAKKLVEAIMRDIEPISLFLLKYLNSF